jgi:hypothetical protein
MSNEERMIRALLGTLIAIRDLGAAGSDAWNLANMAQCTLQRACEILEIDASSTSLAVRLKEEGLSLVKGDFPPTE